MSDKTIGEIRVYGEQATELAFDDLHDWVLWQFPRLRGGWLCGSAQPADPDYDDWIPARIQPHQQRIFLYAHCAPSLATPEEAAEWMANHQDT
jgi:hypothetical protein